VGTPLNPTTGHQEPSPFRWLSRGVALGVSMTAFLVLGAWILVKRPHTSDVMSSNVVMNANTAVGLWVAALALWLLAGPTAPAWRQRFAIGCSLAVAALGAATLSEYLLGMHLGIDRIFGNASSIEINTTHPGRMAPETALVFALMGSALYWMARRRRVLAAQGLTMLVAMLGLFNLTGYVYGVVAFYKLDHESSIGLATAAAFVAMAGGMLCAQPNEGLMGSITSDLPGGVVIRRLLLAVLVLPLALGWLELAGEHAGFFDHARGTGVAGLVGSLALMLLIWRTAKVLNRGMAGRQQKVDNLQQSNELLKQSVRERTVLLASANQSLNRGINERTRLEAMLRLQSSALESAANAISISDRTCRIEWVNPAFCQLSGYSASEAIGHDAQELTKSGRHDAAFHKNMLTKILAGLTWQNEVVQRCKDGSNYTVIQTITPVRDKRGQISHFISIEEDVTEKKELEEQALRAQRVQNLGMLAAGIAHDFNNALAPILLAAPLLRPQVESVGGQRMLDIIEQSSERGAALVRQMLSFARGTADHKVIVQVDSVLREVITIAKTTFPKAITVESDMPEDLWHTVGDPTQINQVFMNLFINARDAMPQGGELVIAARNRTLDVDEIKGIEDARPGRYISVEVRDSGTGIPPEVLERIWEPFFTTKDEGKGTGLGLSTVRGIVRQHEGFMSVRTNAECAGGIGTAFTVFMPAVAVVGHDDGHEAAPGKPPRRGEGELILIVDDEESVLEVGERILVSQGYRVLTAGDGADAISVFGPRASEVRLLITDNEMPILGGTALVIALRRLNPGLPVIIISGAGGRSINTDGLFATEFLAKPFTAVSFMSMVRRTLDASPSASPCLV
jgi:PAS domain S-box-containing protein